MKLTTIGRGLAAALFALAVQPGAVQAAEPAAQTHIIEEGGTVIAMEGDKVIAKFNEEAGEASQYIYLNGRVWQASYSDGTVTSYSYDKEGKLTGVNSHKFARDKDGKISPVPNSATSQRPFYAGGKLIALVSSSGKRLSMAGTARGDVAMRIRCNAHQAERAAPSADERTKQLNYRLIGIHGWDTQDSEWECDKTPEGEDICTGRPPPDAPPPDDGGDDDGGVGREGEPPGDVGPPASETPPSTGESGDPGRGGALNPQPRADLPTLESCRVAAYNTYWIMMDQVCKFPKDRKNCEAQAFLIYEDQMAECAVRYPS